MLEEAEMTSEEAEMTSTSSKLTILVVFSIVISGLAVSHNHQTTSVYDQTSFELPQYDTHEEVLIEFVAPFLFVSILLTLLYAKVLHAIFKDKDDAPYGNPYWVEDEDKPDVKRYALLLGVLTTAVIVPTEFWAWIQLAISSIGVLVTIGFALLVVYIMYLMR